MYPGHRLHLPPQPLPETSTSHPDNPIPQEPPLISAIQGSSSEHEDSPYLSASSLVSNDVSSASDPCTPNSNGASELSFPKLSLNIADEASDNDQTIPDQRRASTMLVSQDSQNMRRILGDKKVCCGGGCCMLPLSRTFQNSTTRDPVRQPNNQAFRSLKLGLGAFGLDSELSNIISLPEKTATFLTERSRAEVGRAFAKGLGHPPSFVTPHYPYGVYSAPLQNARELTKPGAEKRTYHFDVDVTDYPEEGGDVDFVVGGAIGVCAPNSQKRVESILDHLGVPRFLRDKPVVLQTTKGRWPTVWGCDQPREVITTRRELLTWCSDIQSYAPTKSLIRLLAEYADEPHEQKILLYLCSAQGQAAFCHLRTSSHVSLLQLLSAFPSSRPPLDHLLSVLPSLMPRFYSLSQDPQGGCPANEQRLGPRRLIEFAVSVHESEDFADGVRTGVGSGFLERTAQSFIAAKKAGFEAETLNFRIPMFRGLMSNPLAKEFVADGPMLLIGAGVGVAPFRGFVHRRLRAANCANKVWVLQGVRDSLVDELYSGDWGVHEEKVKKIVQSRRGEKRYVQEEVRAQADLVWFIINALDGRVFVCGSSKGMGEGVERALVDVAIGKGNLNHEEAQRFWAKKKEAGQYIVETW